MKKLRPLVFSFLLLSVSANAQDTEIYMRTSLQPPKPNVVFIIDTSTSMERLAKFSLLPISIKSRIYMVKEALKSAINDAQGINIALMKLNRFENAKSKCEAPSVGYVLVNGCHSGGKFITPMLDVDLPGNKQRLINAIDTKATTTKGLSPQVGLRIVANYTPIVEATHEAMRFYRGETVKYGLYHKVKPYLLDAFGLFSMQDKGLQLLSDSATIDNTTLPLSINSKYQSPITDQCQRNHIVLFTDGASTFDRESDAEINTMLDNLGRANLPTELQTRCQTYNSWNEFQSKQSCLNDLAYVLYNTDNSPQFSGKQRIQFHALAGFFSMDNVLTSFADMVDALDILDIGLAHPIYNAAEDSFAAHAKRNLRKAAQYGNGFYATPNTFEEIKTAINTTFQEIIDTSATFAAPTIPANIFDNIGFFDQVYYPVFKARGNAGWSGNLKRYQMTASGLQDANGDLALDAQGDFKDSTQSFWSQEVDGKNALLGGLASRLATPRPIVSNLSSGDLNNDSANQITTSNHLLTATALGAEGYDDDSLLELKKWLAGYDVKGGNESQPRFELEDALHTTPVILNYGKTQDSQGHEIADSTIFFGSNSGFLHAFDTHIDHPKERFSFIPKELLPIATKYYEGIGGKHYGLDGPISVWHDDQNQDRIVNNGEHAILYVGMRRGGRDYYAIDVSNRDKPKLLWQINGGTAGYSRLGQTWSKAVVSQVKWPNAQGQTVARKVVIFAGGYDAAEDDYNTRTSHNMGNAIYMVDALTGQLLWRASNEATAELHLPQMTSSIVGNVAVVDDNEDGYADLLYFADLGGRIWRIDFKQNQTTNAYNYATGGIIADLGADNSIANNVRFYNSLDVVYSKAFDKVNSSGGVNKSVPRYVLSIGSGYRAHPLDDQTNDHFYVVFDYHTNGAPSSYSQINRRDLAAINLNQGTTQVTASNNSNNGFYLKLIDQGQGDGKGEKVLSKASTLNNVIYFTSFRAPSSAFNDNCEPNIGEGRLYSINMQQGNAKIASTELNTVGIPPEPVFFTYAVNGNKYQRKTKVIVQDKVIDAFEPEASELVRSNYWRDMN